MGIALFPKEVREMYKHFFGYPMAKEKSLEEAMKELRERVGIEKMQEFLNLQTA